MRILGLGPFSRMYEATTSLKYGDAKKGSDMTDTSYDCRGGSRSSCSVVTAVEASAAKKRKQQQKKKTKQQQPDY